MFCSSIEQTMSYNRDIECLISLNKILPVGLLIKTLKGLREQLMSKATLFTIVNKSK